MKQLLLCISVLIISFESFAQSCNQLPLQFESFSIANRQITGSTFQFVDNLKISKSSWIRSAQYYSCDNITGYFFLITDHKTYIHKDVPIQLWKNFVSTSSYGNFYNINFKGKFPLRIVK